MCTGQKAVEHRLPIKVVRTEYNFDGGRLIIYFTVDKRIDFRASVRATWRASFVVGSRCARLACAIQAKFLDGVGKCGRRLCCSSWLVQLRASLDQDGKIAEPAFESNRNLRRVLYLLLVLLVV